MTLTARLGAALSHGLAQDIAMLPGDVADGATDEAVPAAVLIAVTDRAKPGVILTQRTDTLRKHAGQVAFPGGRLDPGEDAVAAAVREAHEEIALDPAAVIVVGTADRYRTITGYAVTPVLAVVPPDLSLVPAEAEVADVFEVPLDFVLATANHRVVDMDWQGRRRHYHQIDWEGRRIWGATAAMIVNLSRRLRW
ncbi:MAG: CoA pyrophosphatase [Pseudomonadota bacterium]